MDWPRFLRFLLVATGAFGSALYAFILILDPYQNVPFSPDLPRAPISQNQRFAYPAIARSPDFEGLILGTSTARLIDPERLGQPSGARFANLAMNSATAYEQVRMHELFLRHHPHMKYLVFVIDETWCNRAKLIERYTFRDFPEWMYDENPYNDLLYMFNDKALENSARMLELLLGAREPRYRRDGYRNFTLDFGTWNEAAVMKRLYADGPAEIPVAGVEPAYQHSQWHFSLLLDLAAVIKSTPASARVVLLFPPLHAAYIAPRAELLAECKGRVQALIAHDRRSEILDYMYVSALTRNDANYWDPIHINRDVAAVIERDLSALFSELPPGSPYARHYGQNPTETVLDDGAKL